MPWQHHLHTHGYAHLKALTPPPLVAAALEAIQSDLQHNFDPRRQAEYDDRSYCPDLCAAPPIMNLLAESPALQLLDEALGLEHITWNPAQIAIRRGNPQAEPAPPEPHIDGFAQGANQLQAGRIYNHTVLVGIYLTPVRQPYAGNFTVWPGSHLTYERWFRERGPQAQHEPMPRPPLGPPLQLMCEPGDVVLAHYALAHAAAANASGQDRIAIYFRVGLRAIETDRWAHLVDLWRGWKPLPA